jgi:hypothetical protein
LVLVGYMREQFFVTLCQIFLAAAHLERYYHRYSLPAHVLAGCGLSCGPLRVARNGPGYKGKAPTHQWMLGVRFYRGVKEEACRAHARHMAVCCDPF